MASTMTQVVSTCDEGLVRERAGSWGGFTPKTNKQLFTVQARRMSNECP